MKLELKDIVGYLPYGLELMYASIYDHEKDYTQTINPHFNSYDLSDVLSGEHGGFVVKPLLIPLNELSEEQYDHIFINDKEGVMAMWLDNIHAVFMKRDYCDAIYEYLYSIHADIHGLIEKGLAINKNKVK